MTREIAKLTWNLRKRIAEIEKVIDFIWRAVFIEVYEEHLPKAQALLETNLEEALTSSEEFSISEFADPLKNAVASDNVIFFLPEEGSSTIQVQIDLESVAGTIENYIEAVEQAREVGDFGTGDPRQASYYWKEYIYKPAREGTDPPKGTMEQAQSRYINTIQLRKQYYAGLAPYWVILEDGSQAVEGRGGFPYPNQSPTRFVDKTEKTLTKTYNKILKEEKKQFEERFENEAIEYKKILKEIAEVITQVGRQPEEYKTPQIIRQLEIANQKYNLYITNSGQLGLSKRPRI